MTDQVPDQVPPVVELDRIAETFAKVKELLEVSSFSFGPLWNAEEAIPNRKASLSSWTNHYWSLVMKPGLTIQKLYPAINHWETLDAETLKTEKSQLIRQLQPQVPV